MTHPPPARLAAWIAVVAFALVGGTVTAASLDRAATVASTAGRGDRVQVTGRSSACERVAMVGDSLTYAVRNQLRTALRDAGYTAIVDGQISRRIPGRVPDPYSGVRTARSIRASWGEAHCWVIALGSNDLENGADEPGAVDAMLDEMVGAVTPGARVWWVNVNYLREPGNSFDFPAATAVFNDRLDARANAAFRVVDYYSASAANPQWFDDAVHLFAPGYRARTEMIVAALAAG